MRILFTHSYFLHFDPKQWEQMQPYAPLGTLYAASMLRNSGYDVMLHDVMFEESPHSITPLLQSFKPDILVIYDDGFNYLTKMCLTNMREAAWVMSELAKQYGCKVIVSSSDATDHSDMYLDHGADFILIGEGEQTLLETVNSIRDDVNNFDMIPGLVFYKNGSILRTMHRKVMQDLDALPTPAWDLADIPKYKEAWMKKHGYFSINISTTRGCPFKCNWCAKPIYGNHYNARSAELVVAELKQLQETYQFDHIWFCDDIFALKPGWIKRFAELVSQQSLKFKYKIQSRADLLLKDEQIVPLALSGCETVWIGAESGSQKILDAMDKGITIQQIQDATTLLKKNGIRVAYFLQFGYLDETKDDIDLTLQMLQRNMPDDIGISVSYPLPGTKFYDKVKEQLKEKTNWSDSDELALMFLNNYTPSFYKSLHQYVHAYYRRIRAIDKIRRPSTNMQYRLSTLIKLPYYTAQYLWHKRLLKQS